MMDVREILQKVKNNELSIADAEAYFRRAPFEELGYAKLDTHRYSRSGFAEVVFCGGKTDEQLVQIFKHLVLDRGEALGTRATQDQYERLCEIFPDMQYDPVSRQTRNCAVVLSSAQPVQLISPLPRRRHKQRNTLECMWNVSMM